MIFVQEMWGRGDALIQETFQEIEGMQIQSKWVSAFSSIIESELEAATLIPL